MLITEYINPWHNSRDKSSPAVYKVNESTKQEEYKGYYIVQGVNPWVDVVAKRSNISECANLAFSCITQVGSVRYAKQWIDNLCEKDVDSIKDEE